MTRKRVPALLCLCTLSASLSAHGASFGTPAFQAVMGQPLQLLLPLTLEDEEATVADCISAEVLSGDRRLPDAEVRVQVQAQPAVVSQAGRQQWLARITTTSPVEEPVLQVRVTAGCKSRFTRQFTALADPPLGLPTAAGTAPVRLPSAVSATSLPPASTAAALRSPSASRSAAAEPGAKPRTPKGPRRERAAAPRERQNDAAGGGRAGAAQRVPGVDQGGARLQLEVASGGPMLKMDIEEPVFMGEAAGAAALALPGAAAGSAPGDGTTQLTQLQAAIAALQGNSKAMATDNQALRERLQGAEKRAAWLPWLAGLLLLSAGGALLLWRRSRALALGPEWWSPSRTDEPLPAPVPPAAGPTETAASLDEPTAEPGQAPPQAWRPAQGHALALDGHADAASEPGLPGTDGINPPTAPGPWSMPTPAMATATAAAVAATIQSGRTAPFGPLVQAQEAPREVSVEELLDLEQQADFFIALGQEDAAIDLLMSYLRSTGGQSPVPYTKLLEIYRRQGDRSAYERIRARFNRRFNAYAPDWDMGPLYGRVLEDYPYAVQELETAWPSPLDAMAVLEGMLFRKDETQDLFDLPAYKDLLLMYAIARDLLQQGGGKTDEVDLLLPLGDFGGPAGLVGGPVGSFLSDEDRAEDLDLVLEDAPDSLLTHFEFNPVLPDSEPMSLDGRQAPAAPAASAPRKPRF
ncbi:MAG TPA: hypothetical protein VLA61_22050 [Ideonella sp.]|uniref:hypothetical protein n=1 Tax=Ideonella sp. TaxID=1929293 RepID=UPI002B706228|nr:hypothetical protein [Ideonella sp.]HSI50958.1 hypothetical protein [Ideonella sp.]